MAAEKARYYLEKAVPELKEYEQKGIFSKVRLNDSKKQNL